MMAQARDSYTMAIFRDTGNLRDIGRFRRMGALRTRNQTTDTVRMLREDGAKLQANLEA